MKPQGERARRHPRPAGGDDRALEIDARRLEEPPEVVPREQPPVRGEEAVNSFDRRIPQRVQRQALTVALLAVAAVVGATLLLMEISRFGLADVLFEVTSAFATVGLSTGITADLPVAGQLLLVGLMFLGRLGPITLVSALALRERQRLYQLPEGRPIIG